MVNKYTYSYFFRLNFSYVEEELEQFVVASFSAKINDINYTLIINIK